MLPNYASWGGLEAYRRRVPLIDLGGGGNGKNTENYFGRHQHIISSMHWWRMVECYLVMPSVVAQKHFAKLCFGEIWKKS